MQPASALTRRYVLGGMGAVIATTATGLGTAPAQALGPTTILTLAGIDFRPRSSADYTYVAPGGVQATSGDGIFEAGLRLPVGSRILRATFFLNPNGIPREVFLVRYRPLNPQATFLAIANSTNGTASESVTFTLKHDLKGKFNYVIVANLGAGVAGAILYGAKVRYRPPA